MYSTVSRKDLCNISETENKKEDDEQEENENPSLGLLNVTTHLYLKPAHTTDTLDKNVVLRRIRHHRKRVNKVKSAVEGLFRSPFDSNPQIKWADNAFAAL
ncbi:Uncharacterized protein Adt_19774 [Abeliophyllum distichum]|uniref:Uncharacterized protein n=1 Tax=Abeliophyllum distichum TaxID=126358 RepID=A0ABD1STV8_9LAMI